MTTHLWDAYYIFATEQVLKKLALYLQDWEFVINACYNKHSMLHAPVVRACDLAQLDLDEYVGWQLWRSPESKELLVLF